MGRLHRAVMAVATATALVAGSLVAATPAQAVMEPWRWVRVDQTVNIPALSDAEIAVPCPAGYVPVTGGWHSSNNAVWLKRHYADRFTNNYVLLIHNWTNTVRPVYPTAWCAHADDVGGIVWVSNDFTEVNNRAGGTTTCPEGYGVIAGGADWYTFGDRHVEYSGPTPAGDGWFASGTSAAVNDTLAIEVGCIPDAALQGEQVVTAVTDVGSNTDVVRTASCPAGMRVLTGGGWAGPSGTSQRDTAYRGDMYRSVAGNAWSWSAGAIVTAGSRFTSIALCIPQSIPVVTLTQVPPKLHTSGSGTFAFTASDPAGEALTYGCAIGVSVPCSPGQVSFGPLTDGAKTLIVSATNAEGRLTSQTYQFVIDTTSPTVVDRSPLTTAGINQQFTMTFSEPVTGVGATTVQVFAAGSSTPVPGTVSASPSPASATSATWTPRAKLLPGQTYTVQLGTAIQDAAGWPLTPPEWEVRADVVVENTSAAVVESWDRDESAKASGGRFIENRTAGSRASLTFTAPASGEVSLYGIRRPAGGYGDIYLDGVRKAKASFYGARTKRARVFHHTGLKPGSTHTLEVRVLGTKPRASKGTWVALDSVSLGAKTRQETALKQSFRRVAAGGASGGSYDTVAHAARGDTGGVPAYTLKFRGTSIAVRAVLSPSAGKAAIYVDGALKKTVSLRSAGAAHDVEVFSLQLSDAVHTVKVVPLGTRTGAASFVGVDRFVVG